MEDRISMQYLCERPTKRLRREIASLVATMTEDNGVEFPLEVRHDVDRGRIGFQTMFKVSETIMLNFYKAAVVCNTMETAAHAARGTIPEGLRDPKFDAFIPNNAHLQLRAMLDWQYEHHRRDYDQGLWPLPQAQLAEFIKQVSTTNDDGTAFDPCDRNGRENGEAVGLGP